MIRTIEEASYSPPDRSRWGRIRGARNVVAPVAYIYHLLHRVIKAAFLRPSRARRRQRMRMRAVGTDSLRLARRRFHSLSLAPTSRHITPTSRGPTSHRAVPDLFSSRPELVT